MLVIYGIRNIRTRKYIDSEHMCNNCCRLDIDVKVYKDYYHFFYIPIFPLGITTVKMHCRHCGQPVRIDRLSNYYEEKTRAPFYLYTGPIIIVAFVIVAVFGNLRNQKQKALYINAPKLGDVYMLYNDDNGKQEYSFLKIYNIEGDTLAMHGNVFSYGSFISRLDNKDYFAKENTLKLSKEELKLWLENATIVAVKRNYSDETGFNKVR